MSGRTRAQRQEDFSRPIAATRQEALRQIAEWAGGVLSATEIGEILLNEDLSEDLGEDPDLTPAEWARYEWAKDAVLRRIYAIGEPRRSR